MRMTVAKILRKRSSSREKGLHFTRNTKNKEVAAIMKEHCKWPENDTPNTIAIKKKR